MPRNLVTRTVTGTEVTAKVIDKVSEQVQELTIVLSASFKGENAKSKMTKAVNKYLEESNPNAVLFAITGSKEVNKCYGVSTAKFMEIAQELDPETRKALATEEAAEEAAE